MRKLSLRSTRKSCHLSRSIFQKTLRQDLENRELAALFIKEFFTKVDDLTLRIPYLLPALIDLLNAEDLKEIVSLPEAMKLLSGQKANVMKDPPEPCVEVRATISEIVTIISSTDILESL
jgi:hypothetical protein